MFQVGMAEEAGHGFDVGAIVEDVDGEGVACAVPGDVFFDAGMVNPSLD